MVYINGRFLTQRLTGTQRYAYELTRLLLNMYADIVILMPKVAVDESYDVVGFPLKKIGLNKTALWEQIDLPFFLKTIKSPFLLNLTNTAPLFYKNQFITIHDMCVFINPKWFNIRFSTYYKILVPKIARKARCIITNSTNSKKDIITYTGVEEAKIKIINSAVSIDFLTVAFIETKEDLDTLERYSLIKGKYFISVSSLDPRKNFINLIKAYLKMDTSIPLVIVGSKVPSFRNENMEEYRNNNNIIFTGYLTDKELVALYKSALCFIYPSLYEGFGLPPLEAMSCGCPTIVSNNSSLPEVYADASIYVNPLDIDSIADAMQLISSDKALRHKLIKLGNQNVKRFSWHKSAQLLLNEIKCKVFA